MAIETLKGHHAGLLNLFNGSPTRVPVYAQQLKSWYRRSGVSFLVHLQQRHPQCLQQALLARLPILDCAQKLLAQVRCGA